jgi:hypothetical protein
MTIRSSLFAAGALALSAVLVTGSASLAREASSRATDFSSAQQPRKPAAAAPRAAPRVAAPRAAPRVVTPRVVTPRVVTPRVVTPRAPRVVTPRTVTPRVVTPQVETTKKGTGIPTGAGAPRVGAPAAATRVGAPAAAPRVVTPRATANAGTVTAARIRGLPGRGAGRAAIRGQNYSAWRSGHRVRHGGGWRTFAALSALGAIAIGAATYYPYAYISAPQDYCDGLTEDGCQLQWQDVQTVEGDVVEQCVAYCPWR